VTVTEVELLLVAVPVGFDSLNVLSTSVMTRTESWPVPAVPEGNDSVTWRASEPAAASAVTPLSRRWSAMMAPVVTLVMSNRSDQAAAAATLPMLTSCQLTVIEAPDWIVPPEALTARPWTCRSGAGVLFTTAIGTGVDNVSSNTLKP
jgi:hypothetical protein